MEVDPVGLADEHEVALGLGLAVGRRDPVDREPGGVEPRAVR
jgi:hypothetical protein